MIKKRFLLIILVLLIPIFAFPCCDKEFYLSDSTKTSTVTVGTYTNSIFGDFFSKKFPQNKNDINLSLSIPYVNSFNFKPEAYGTRSNTGFWGISTGLEYFYKSNKFIGVKFVGAIDLFIPVPASPGGDIIESMGTSFIEITDNFHLGRFYIGYGINYASNNWRFTNEINTENEIEIRRTNKSFGITTNAYIQLSNSFFIGVMYRPSFYSIKPTTGFKYEHLISLDLAWKISLRKRQSKNN